MASSGDFERGGYLCNLTMTMREKLIKDIVAGNKDGALEGNDEATIRALFLLFYTPSGEHTKYTNDEVKGFKVGSEQFNTRCIIIVAERDGKKIEEPCGKGYLSGRSRPHARDRTVAMRKAIDPQIEEWRRKRPSSDHEVDHVNPFCKIKDDFEASWVKSGKDLPIGKTLRGDFEEAWIEYHKVNAELQYLTKKENRLKGGK